MLLADSEGGLFRVGSSGDSCEIKREILWIERDVSCCGMLAGS